MAEFSYNNSKHSATTLSPFFANYGFHPNMSLLPTDPDSKTPAADSYVNRPRWFFCGSFSKLGRLWRFQPIAVVDLPQPSCQVLKCGS